MPENFQNVPAEKIRCKEREPPLSQPLGEENIFLWSTSLSPFWAFVDDDDANVDIGDDHPDADDDIGSDDAKTFSLINFTLLPLWKDERSCLTFSKTLYSGGTYYERQSKSHDLKLLVSALRYPPFTE